MRASLSSRVGAITAHHDIEDGARRQRWMDGPSHPRLPPRVLRAGAGSHHSAQQPDEVLQAIRRCRIFAPHMVVLRCHDRIGRSSGSPQIVEVLMRTEGSATDRAGPPPRPRPWRAAGGAGRS